MAAPVGAEVGLYYDAGWRSVAPGDFIQTGTGRSYLVVQARQQARGERRGRWHLRAVVVAAPDAGAVVHPLRWYRR